jgi:hypothetical protein
VALDRKSMKACRWPNSQVDLSLLTVLAPWQAVERRLTPLAQRCNRPPDSIKKSLPVKGFGLAA